MRAENLKIIKKILNKNTLEEPGHITKFATGQINESFEIDGKYVIKLEGQLEFAHGIFWHQTEILGKLLELGAKVPKIIDAGEIAGKGYILMDRLPGRNLIYDWLSMAQQEKEGMLAQLAEQLRIVHSIKFDQYSIPIYRGKKYDNLLEAIGSYSDFSKINKKALDASSLRMVNFLEDFLKQHKSAIDEKNTPVLVHNDIHLENIYHEDGMLTGIIDWDWASQAPKDYEVWRMVDFCRDPQKFMEKKLGPKYEKYSLAGDIKLLRKYYPELFSSPELVTRIRLFLLDTLINLVADYQSGRWNESVLDDFKIKVYDFYQSDWLPDTLLG